MKSRVEKNIEREMEEREREEKGRLSMLMHCSFDKFMDGVPAELLRYVTHKHLVGYIKFLRGSLQNKCAVADFYKDII
jgi:hypothetical protein